MNAVVGLLGGALSLLIWLYLLAMGLLVGAEINRVLSDRRDLHTTTDAPSKPGSTEAVSAQGLARPPERPPDVGVCR